MTLFSLFHEGKIKPTSGKKVIPKEAFSELLEAIDVVHLTKEDAVKYKESIKSECEVIKAKAEEKGFEEGLAKLMENIASTNQHLAKMRHEMQNQILPLALKAAKKIVGDQLTLKPDIIVDIVMATLKPVIQSLNIRILVSKADKPFLDAKKEQIKLLLERVEHLSIEERHDITPGGCIIETESGIINATLENQWRAIEAAFAKFLS